MTMTRATLEGRVTLTAEEEAEAMAQALVTLRRDALQRLKRERESVIDSPYSGLQVKTAKDRERIKGAIANFDLLTQGVGYITWTMEDNTEQDLTLGALQAVDQGYVVRVAQTFAAFQAKKAAVLAASTIDEINTILES